MSRQKTSAVFAYAEGVAYVRRGVTSCVRTRAYGESIPHMAEFSRHRTLRTYVVFAYVRVFFLFFFCFFCVRTCFLRTYVILRTYTYACL